MCVSLTLRQYLKQAFTIQKNINAEKSRIMYLKEMSVFLGMSFSHDGVKTKHKQDKTADIVVELEECKSEILRLLSLQREIKRLVNSMPCDKGRLILYEHYVLLKKWPQVAKATDYSESQVYKIHNEALKELEKKMIVNDSTTCVIM